MDARLNFANTRKMKEFCLKAVAIREATGETIDWVIVDCKSINHVDLTGGEMLEVLAETLKGKNQRLVLINVKGPVGKCLTLAHVPRGHSSAWWPCLHRFEPMLCNYVQSGPFR